MPSVTIPKESLEAIAASLRWFIANDETNRGDHPLETHGGRTWDEINSFWIAGLDEGERCIALIESAISQAE